MNFHPQVQAMPNKRITKETLQKYFLRHKMIRSLGDELLRDETEETNPCVNNHEYTSISRYN